MITLIPVIIFVSHQFHAFLKIDPIGDVRRQPVFRAESLSLLYAFIATIGTFLPIEYYLPPTLFIYAGTNYLTYHFAEKRDQYAFEAFTIMFLNVTLGTAAAWIIHLVVDEGFKFEGNRGLLDVMKD